MSMAGRLVSRSVPREASSAETRAMARLSGASTILTKSYGPSVAHCATTLTPNASSSALTSLIRSGLCLMVLEPSSVRLLSMTYVGMATSWVLVPAILSV